MSFLSQPITLQSIFGAGREIVAGTTSISLQVVVSEETTDVLTITKQPTQIGAAITDHAFQEPTIYTATVYQQNNATISGFKGTFAGAGMNGLAQIYQTFLTLQTSRTPFNILTPKRIYKNMLMASLRCLTDKNTENILSLNFSCQQILLVQIGVAKIPASQQANAATTQATQDVGNQSALFKLFGGLLR